MNITETLGLTFGATFVPFSKSRNAKPDPKVSDLNLNWRVSFNKGSQYLVTDYLQGHGHIPGQRPSKLTTDDVTQIRTACESGRYFVGSGFAQKPLPAPDADDVLESLLLDSDVLEHATFESWASDFGYDTDSRKAEQVYRACLEIALQLRAMIGDEGMRKAREMFDANNNGGQVAA